MKLLAKIFRWLPIAPAQSFAESQMMLPETRFGGGGASKATNTSTRRELLRVVLRDTLYRQGIPAAWLGADALVCTSRSGAQGLYWRLIVRHWDPRLLTHAMALQQKLIERVMTFDPLAANWLMGISWQFALPDESACPGMPHPGSWTAARPEPAPAKPKANEATVDVIAGPVRISHPVQARQEAEAPSRKERERLFGTTLPQSQFLRTAPMPLE